MTHPCSVLDHNYHSSFGQTQQLIYSVLPQQHVLVQWAIIRLARM